MEKKTIKNSRPLPDVAMTGKCTRECDEYGHSDACWMPVRTSPERRPSQQVPTSQQPPKLSTFMTSSGGVGGAASEQAANLDSPLAVANGDAAATSAHHLLGDRNRNLLNKKMSTSSSSYDAFATASYAASNPEDPSRPHEDIPLAQTGDYKPTTCGTLTRREVYLWLAPHQSKSKWNWEQNTVQLKRPTPIKRTYNTRLMLVKPDRPTQNLTAEIQS